MTVETRARRAAEQAHERVATMSVPDPSALVRRANHRRRRTSTIVVLAVCSASLAGAIAVIGSRDETSSVTALPAGAAVAGDWAAVPKAAAGIDAGASLYGVTADDGVALLAGAVPHDSEWTAALWRSTDGVRWEAADVPDGRDEVTAVALDGEDGLAFGPGFVWATDDAGTTWSEVETGRDPFGPPAPEMGRPFVDRALRSGGWWVAAGGASDGYAGIWVSRDGAEWDQVLATEDGGSVGLASDGGNLFAWGQSQWWETDDPTSWSTPNAVQLPDGRYLRSVATGAELAVAAPFDDHVTPTPLLRRDGNGWSDVPSFLAQHPGAIANTIDQFDGLTVVGGWSDEPNRPDAWVSDDLERWDALPAALQGDEPGGMVHFVTEVGGRVVLFGGAPELDRFYVYEP